jgi:hypothetical protein
MSRDLGKPILVGLSLLSLLSGALQPGICASFPGGGGSFTPPPKITVTPPVTVTPPSNPTPPMRPPIIQIPQSTPMVAPIQSIDLTHNVTVGPEEITEDAGALGGIKSVNGFPDEGRDGIDQVFARGTQASKFRKTNSYTVQFDEGEVLVSVRKPTRVGFATFAFGTVALNPDADIMLKRVGDVFHIVNFDGRGETVKIKLNGSSGASQDAKVIALAPGYEVVVGNHVLNHSDIRIADGCARRHFKSLDDGKVVVCEISTESVLTSSSIVATLHRKSSEEMERKVIGDMSKMAAVLNYVNGTEGYQIVSK